MKKNILIINTVPFIMGGMSSVIMSYLKNMDKNDMDITMIVNSKIEKVYEDDLKKQGIKKIVLKRNKAIIKYMYELYKIMIRGKFDVIHIHGNSSTMCFETLPAYLSKIKTRIVHNHNVSSKYKVLNKILFPILNITYTKALACSNEAGEWLFKDKKAFSVLNNAISLNKYKFDIVIRNEIRKELGLENSYIIGHVGCFNNQKNHEKLFEILAFLKNKIDVKLVCISGTEIPKSIYDMIKKYNLENNIKILLRRDDVNRILQGIDFFIFPSKYEGLGLALIEAQATGVQCLASTSVPKAAGVCRELVTYMDLAEDSSEWGKVILKIIKDQERSRQVDSLRAINKLRNAGYEIEDQSEKLRSIYMNNLEE